MPITEKEILEAIRTVDTKFNDEGFVRWKRWRSRYPRNIFAVPAVILIYVGFQYIQIATNAAQANQIELSVAIQALILAIVAVIIAFVPLINGGEAVRAEEGRFRNYVFNEMKSSVANPILPRVLLRMKTWLPEAISLEQVYNANKTLFTEEELTRRLLG